MVRISLVLAFVAASILVGCEGCPAATAGDGGSAAGGADGGGAQGTSDDGGDPNATADGGGNGGVDAGPPQVQYTLVIEPADAVLTATVGGAETLQLTAVLVDENGGRTPAQDAFWATLTPEIGDVDGTGLFTPSRERAGIARVRARAQGIEAVGEVTVRLTETVDTDGAGVTAADFDGPVSASPGPNVLYPSHDVVIPANLAPILFQWDKVKARARVALSGDLGSLTLYTTGDRAEAPALSWRTFLLAHLGESFSAVVEESDGPGTEVVRTELTIHLAEADLKSTVYYWAVNVGNIVRIDADSLVPAPIELAYENVANGGLPGNPDDQQCRGCHTVSASGQHMAFTYFEGNGPGGVVDVNSPGAPTVPNRGDRRWNFAAISPDGSLLLTNYGLRLTLRSGLTGDAIAGQEDVTGSDVAHPAFSPVGDRVAFAGDVAMNGEPANWEIDFNSSNLYVAPVDALAPSVGAAQMLVPGEGGALYYPSFSPAGNLLAYTKGPHSRSVDGNGTITGEIWIAAANATPDAVTGVPRVRLDIANPGQNSYLPTFNPKVEGGYLWVAFYSRRDYGHVIRGEGRPQIWVAAIDANADPATALADPSHPAFWLPGQVTTTNNLSSFFAPAPCAPQGGSCDSDGACCNGLLCRPGDVAGDWQCVPPEGACLLTGDSCADDSECCDGLLCGVASAGGDTQCLPPGEVCSELGQLCQLDADCCDGEALCSDDGTGTTRCAEPLCSQLGQSCAERPCCDGAGVCLDDLCTLPGG